MRNCNVFKRLQLWSQKYVDSIQEVRPFRENFSVDELGLEQGLRFLNST